jgi:NtrC-family two-component system response regulator AlgB
VLTLEIPPLRERRDDIQPLAERFLAFFGSQYHKPGLRLSAEAVRLVLAYPWPGNVRELRNAVERATMLAAGAGELVGPELLLPKGAAPAPAAAPIAGGGGGEAAIGEAVTDAAGAGDAAALELGDLAPLSAIEQEHIRRVLGRTASLREAAAVLGIDQATLWRRRKQQGL